MRSCGLQPHTSRGARPTRLNTSELIRAERCADAALSAMAIPRGRALRAVEAAQAAQAAQSAQAAQASSSSSADRRGELQFTATFEGGNLGNVTKVSELEYELSLRPDSNNPKYRLWCASSEED